MNSNDFTALVEPINMLIGYSRSATNLTSESSLKNWGDRLIQLADNLALAWDGVIMTAEPGDGK